MFGKRCTLCGGKLNSERVCTECGLDNSRSEKYYKINESSCDGMPLTHTHPDDGEQNQSKWYDAKKYLPRQSKSGQPESKQYEPKKYESKQYGSKQYEFKPHQAKKEKRKKEKRKDIRWEDTGMGSGRRKKGGWAKRIAFLFNVFLIGMVIFTVIDSVNETETNKYASEEYDHSPYSQLDEKGIAVPEEGQTEEFSLLSGCYIVGVHLPAGNYTADTKNEYDAVKVRDDENSIYLYEYSADEEGNYLDDLRLFDGAVVEIEAEAPVVFRTENAQEVHYEETPLTQDYRLSGSGQKEAGKDFEPGVYDLTATKGSGIVKYTVFMEDAADDENGLSRSIYMAESETKGNVYNNVVLPEGAKIKIEDYEEENGMIVRMSPSPRIVSTDYMETYRQYYY